MGRLVAIVVIVVLIVWLLRRAMAGPRSRAPGAGEAAQSSAQSTGTAQADLVRCAQCGVNLPRTEAVLAGDRVYCSEEHSRIGPRDG